jgi:hypothetical protein
LVSIMARIACSTAGLIITRRPTRIVVASGLLQSPH